MAILTVIFYGNYFVYVTRYDSSDILPILYNLLEVIRLNQIELVIIAKAVEQF